MRASGRSTQPAGSHEPPRTGVVGALGWGFYVACSWTWVIGMYLPVLLVRNYGLWGWVAFAVPNVLGAAALGWIFRHAGAAQRFAQEHGGVAMLFSLVTVSFQIFVLLWLLPRLLGWQAVLLVLPVLLLAVSAGAWRVVATRGVALAVWLVSAGLMVVLGIAGVLELPRAAGVEPTWHLTGLVPATILGFLLCPYLDLTFLHARASTSVTRSRIAFGIGFGVFFLAMIVFTLLYALPLAGGVFAGVAAWMLATHLALQIGFTIAAHLDRLTEPPGEPETATPDRRAILPALIAFLLIAVILAMAALQADYAGARLLQNSPGELIYRGFMGCYGLLFPAYILLVAIGGASLRAWLITCLLALPFYGVGFLGGLMPWTAAGVVIVIGGFFVARREAGQPVASAVSDNS